MNGDQKDEFFLEECGTLRSSAVLWELKFGHRRGEDYVETKPPDTVDRTCVEAAFVGSARNSAFVREDGNRFKLMVLGKWKPESKSLFLETLNKYTGEDR